jgi:hypothetical protein
MELESFHLTALTFSFIVVAIADHDGWRYFRGITHTLQVSRLKRLHTLAWVGLGGMIATGMILVAEKPDVLQETMFYVKMLMVLALVINGIFIGRMMRVATMIPFAELSARQRWPLLFSGAVSVACWVGAAILGSML